MTLNIPQPVLQALQTLRDQGIHANIYPVYGTAHIHFIISLPDVEIKEIDESAQTNSVDR